MYELLYQNVVPKYPENIFYRQSVNCGYILDFYCPTLRIGIEVDGSIHERREAYDKKRDKVLNQNNINGYHFSNQDVLDYPQNVAFQLCQIIQRQKNRQHSCFIATATYGTSTSKELAILRNLRDVKLESNFVGRKITDLYYSISPPIAHIITYSEKMRTALDLA